MADFELGPNHQPGMRVPEGGSNCAKCKFLKDNKTDCGNKYFVEWNGSPKIPGDINAYCSDWFETKKGAFERAKEYAVRK